MIETRCDRCQSTGPYTPAGGVGDWTTVKLYVYNSRPNSSVAPKRVPAKDQHLCHHCSDKLGEWIKAGKP